MRKSILSKNSGMPKSRAYGCKIKRTSNHHIVVFQILLQSFSTAGDTPYQHLVYVSKSSNRPVHAVYTLGLRRNVGDALFAIPYYGDRGFARRMIFRILITEASLVLPRCSQVSIILSRDIDHLPSRCHDYCDGRTACFLRRET